MQEKIENETLARGLGGTARTIDRMHELVKAGKLDPTMHRIATWIRLQTGDKRSSSRELVDAIFYWTKRHGLYQRDPFQIERIEHPIASMQPIIEARRKGIFGGRALFVGDCDLFSIWVATLGGILGYQYSFETVKLDPARPEEFSHIYPALQVNGKWVAYDSSTPRATPDWRPVPKDKVTRWLEKNIEDVGMSAFNGRVKEDTNINSEGFIEESLYNEYYQSNLLNDEDMFDKPLIPEIDMGVQQLLPPPQPMRKKADLMPTKGDQALLKNEPAIKAYERLGMDSQSYFRYPNYRMPIPGVHVAAPGPPGWPWTNQVQLVYGEGQKTLPAAGAAGMGQITSSLISIQPSVTKAEATVAGTIEDVINGVVAKIPNISEAAVEAYKSKKLAEVERARARVEAAKAGQIQAASYSAAGIPRGKSWLEDPLVWVGGAVAIGATAFLLTRKPAKRRRRR